MTKPLVEGQKQKTGPKGPWKMNEATLEKLRQAFSIDATIDEACFYADINPDTYYKWKKNNPEKSEKLERLRLTPILAARQKVAQDAMTDINVAKWMLERKRRKEYAPQLNLADSEGKNMPAPILNVFANIGQEANDDTKRDVIDSEIETKVSKKDAPTQIPENSNIMDDINNA